VNQDARKIRLVMELRQSGINDTQVLSAIERVPRDTFVLPTFVDQAYENTALPIEEGQTISQPFVVAFMTQALEIQDRSKVLEVGTGSGYQASVLSKICRRVFTLERHRTLLQQAEANFKALGYHNIVTRHGDGILGWPEQAPFDRIIVTAAAEEVPEALVEQLAVGGIMVIPVGRQSWSQSVVRLRRTDQGIEREDLLDVRFVPLLPGTTRRKTGVGSSTENHS
jgi:protein-L-isoaspartate(D-aspartate) O-methyltransferase